MEQIVSAFNAKNLEDLTDINLLFGQSSFRGDQAYLFHVDKHTTGDQIYIEGHYHGTTDKGKDVKNRYPAHTSYSFSHNNIDKIIGAIQMAEMPRANELVHFRGFKFGTEKPNDSFEKDVRQNFSPDELAEILAKEILFVGFNDIEINMDGQNMKGDMYPTRISVYNDGGKVSAIAYKCNHSMDHQKHLEQIEKAHGPVNTLGGCLMYHFSKGENNVLSVGIPSIYLGQVHEHLHQPIVEEVTKFMKEKYDDFVIADGFKGI